MKIKVAHGPVQALRIDRRFACQWPSCRATGSVAVCVICVAEDRNTLIESVSNVTKAGWSPNVLLSFVTGMGL